MPGGGGGGGETMQTSKSNGEQVTGPNPFLAQPLQNIGNAAFDWTGKNMTAPGYFPGGTVAARNPADLAARDMSWSTAQNGLNALPGQFQPSIDYLSDAAGGKYLDVANDPNWQAALAASLRPGTENFRDVIAPSISSTFAGSGRTGGGAHFDTMMRGTNDLTRNQADASVKAASDRYGMERGLQSGAAQALPGVLGQMGGQQANWLSVLQGVGQGETAQEQQLLDAANARYSYDKTGQLDWYNRLSQSLQGMYPGGQQIGWQSGSGTGSGGGGGGGGGGGQGMQLAGAGIAAAGTIAAAFI
jgi:hypothetical protein